MKKLFFPVIAIAMYACGGSKTEELQPPINPNDTSNVVVCDSVTTPEKDSLGRPIKVWGCDSHYVSKEVDEQYHKLLEEYEKAKSDKH